MISIIICSRSTSLLNAVEQNVFNSIGVAYEIIAIDNSQKKYGICEAYNIGAAQAKYDYLCFMHEDLAFHTQNWGDIVVKNLKDPEVGVLGVAGGTYQPKAPAGWVGAGRVVGMNVIHTAKGKTQHDFINPFGKNTARVAALDGLWLCCRKEVWQEFKFDAIDFPGFHFYDVDFCLRVASKYTNYITFEVLIEHFSHGTFDKVWMKQAVNFYRKRKKCLPLDRYGFSRTERRALDMTAMQQAANDAVSHGLPKADVVFCLVECLKYNPFNRDTLYIVRRALGAA